MIIQHIVILDDIITSGSTGYLSFLNDFCNDEGFIIADMQRLNATSNTYEQYPGGPMSWIDHVLVPSWLLHKVYDVVIGNDYVSSDHFPLFCNIDSNILKSKLSAAGNEQMSANNSYSGNPKRALNIDWDTVGDYERENFVNSLLDKLKLIKAPHCALQCGDTYGLKLYEFTCKHEQCIDFYFYNIVNAYKDAACVSLPLRRKVVKHDAQAIGWSDFVHDLYRAARINYIQWREAKRPWESALYDEMHKSRRQFKTALRRCRRNRVRFECDKLASAMLKKD